MNRHIFGQCANWTHCDDCGECEPKVGKLLIVSANLGHEAFLAVLCGVCWHRRQWGDVE